MSINGYGKTESGDIIIEVYPDASPSQIISEAAFNLRFGEASTYDALIAHENCTPAWKTVFDNLHSAGLLS